MFDLLRGHRPTLLRQPKEWPMVVLYHSFYPTVDPADPFLSFNLSYQRLAVHLERLTRTYRILNEAEFLEIARDGFRNAKGTCLVTIDDGYRALCRPEVTGLFSAFEVRPLLFLIAGYLEGETVPWYSQLVSLLRRGKGTVRFDNRPWDLGSPVGRSLLYAYIERFFLRKDPALAWRKLQELGRIAGADLTRIDPDMAPMSWEEARGLLDMGWNLGSHAWSHHPLGMLGEPELEQELGESRKLIEERLGITVRTCSYPNGSQSDRVRQVAARHYEVGFAVNSANAQDRYQVPRHDLGAYPFHDFLRYRPLHPGIETLLSEPEGGRGERLKQKASWLLTEARKPNGLVAFKQLNLSRGVPDRLEVRAAEPSSMPRNQNRPRVAVLTRSNPWNRYAVSRLAQELDLVGVVVERDPGDPVFTAEVTSPEWTERGALCLPSERRPWYPLDHPHAALLDCTFGTAWEAFHTVPGTPFHVLPPGESINSPSVEAALDAWQPDYLFVFGTSIVKEQVYGRARRCAVNIHNGLSPEYRGSFTLWWPVYEERPEFIGGTLHLLNPKIDGGDVFFQWQPRLDGSESVPELEMVVQREGIEHTITLLKRLNVGEEVRPVTQEAGTGALYLAFEFTQDVVDTVHAKLRNGLLARFAREQDERRRNVPLLISPDWYRAEQREAREVGAKIGL